MKRPKRQQLRIVNEASLGKTVFKSIISTTKKIDLSKSLHPCLVILDLRRGSLESLDLYIAKHKGIPDREVALELRKLLSGTYSRAKYRIVVREHPDTPIDKGGRPPIRHPRLSKKDREIVRKYREILQLEGKAYLTREEIEKDMGVSISTIRRALKKAEQIELQVQRDAELAAETAARNARMNEMHASALQKLRDKQKGGTS